MGYLMLCTLWIWVFVGISGVVAIQKSGTFAGFQTDKTVTGYDLYSVPVTSKLECVVRCLEDERCTAAVTYCEAWDMLKVSSCILKSISSSPLLSSATKSESGKCFVSLYSLSNDNLGSSSSTSSTLVATNFEAKTEQTITEGIPTSAETTTSSAVVATNFEATTEQTTAEEIPTTAETTTSSTVVATNFEATTEQAKTDGITTTAETTTSSTVVGTNFEATTEQTTVEETTTTAETTTSSTVVAINFEATTEQTSTEGITTTAETTTSSTNPSHILGIVGNLEDICNEGSGKDIALFTKVGIYVYNSKDDLKSSYCMFVYQAHFENLFPGYENDRPPFTDMDCAVGYENYIEVYAENKIWVWAVNTGSTEPSLNSPSSFNNRLGGTILPSNPLWCTYIHRGARDYYFYENSKIILKSNQSPFEVIFTQEEYFIGGNELLPNPWLKLPTNTVAVCSVNDQYTMYIVVTSNMSFYEYETDEVNPTIWKGSIKF